MNIDDTITVLKARAKEATKELGSIPARISELEAQMADIVEPDGKELDRLKSKLEQLRACLAGIRNGAEINNLREQLSKTKADLAEQKAQVETAAFSARGPIIEKTKTLQTDAMQLERQIADLEGQIKILEKRIQLLNEALEMLRKKWSDIDARKPPGDKCDFCEQDLPPDQIQAAQDKFNQKNAADKKELSTKGHRHNATITEYTKDIETAKEKIKEAQGSLDEINGQISELEKSLEATPKAKPNPEIKALEQEAARLEGLISAGKNGTAIQEQNIRGKIETIQGQIDAWKKQQAEYDAAEKTRVRIDELLNQEKTLNAELEDVERKLHLIDRFIIKKVELLEDKINGMFSFAQFKMFKTLVNGNIQPCCDVLCDGVPFDKGLNTAARINTGLDIIQRLGDHFGLRVPVWIDNAESINELHQIDAQVIALTVSDDEKLIVRKIENDQ